MNPHRTAPRLFSLLIVLALLVVSALAFMPVSAASIVVDTDVDGFNSDGKCSLREAIHNANNAAQYSNQNGECAAGTAGADTITFTGDYIITLNGARLPSITSNITITGKGADNTIIQASPCNPVDESCTHFYSVFEVSSSGTLTLNGVTVRHGNVYSGGGILNEGLLTVTNSTISANKAETYGGGIFNEGDDAITTVTSSTFSGNVADNTGGGISNYAGTLTVTSSTFSNNVADNYGGGISNPFGNLTVTASNFLENYAEVGGGISNPYGTAAVTSSSFFGNVAVVGGAINNYGTMTVTSSTFTDNWVFNNGGGIYNTGSLEITDSTVSGNKADFKGGGIFNNGTLVVDQSTFLNNEADLGGGIRNDEGVASKITVTDSTFGGNIADHGGALDNWGDGPNLVNTSDLNLNSVTASGGAIRNWSTLTVENSTLGDNSTDGVGGGINNEGTLTLLNVALNGNIAGGGGGIYTNNTLIMTNSTLSGNSAYDGGGIYNLYNLMINNSTLFGNTASYDGGGILNVSTLNITNSTLSGNTANRGGGILNDGSLNLLHVTLFENIAEQGNGGGIINFSAKTMKFINTIVAHSTSGDCVNLGIIHTESTHNLVTDGSCHALLDDDPMFGPLEDNGGPTMTHALLPGSPAIDAGFNDLCPLTDQRGVVRPYGVGCDIGAFEFDPDRDGVNFIFLPLILC